MKKAEAISILATSVRPREAKDRARYDEAVKMAIEALKSSEQTAESAQNASSCARENDVIFRQAAIDIERNATVDTNPSHFEAHQKFTQFMDDAEISSFGRWQWSNGFNTALTAVGIDLKKLPSAQPDHTADIGKKVSISCSHDYCRWTARAIHGEDEENTELLPGMRCRYERR